MSSDVLTLQPLEEQDKLQAVIQAVASFDLPSSDAWADLAELSTQTSFDDLEANIYGIFCRSDGKIEVVATAYVTLNYTGKKGKESASMTESYPAKIIGSFDKHNQFLIESASVDTSEFFG